MTSSEARTPTPADRSSFETARSLEASGLAQHLALVDEHSPERGHEAAQNYRTTDRDSCSTRPSAGDGLNPRSVALRQAEKAWARPPLRRTGTASPSTQRIPASPPRGDARRREGCLPSDVLVLLQLQVNSPAKGEGPKFEFVVTPENPLNKLVGAPLHLRGVLTRPLAGHRADLRLSREDEEQPYNRKGRHSDQSGEGAHRPTLRRSAHARDPRAAMSRARWPLLRPPGEPRTRCRRQLARRHLRYDPL